MVEEIWRTCFSSPMRPPSARSPPWRWPRSTPRCGTCAAARPACRCTSWPAAPGIACRSTPPKAAGCTSTPANWSRMRWAPRRQGFSGAKIKVGKPSGAEDVARLRRCAQAVGPGLRDHDRRQPGLHRRRGDPARAPLRGAVDLAWFEEPLPADDIEGHVRARPALARAAHRGRREPLQPAAFSRISPARRLLDRAGGRRRAIGGITPWLKVAHLAETFNVAGLPAFPDGAARGAQLRGARTRAGSSTSRSSTPSPPPA